VSINKRWKIGLGANGISQTHVIGFINKDSLIADPNYYNSVYDKVDEIVKGSTVKLQLLYALKPYHGDIGLGWEFDAGAGVTCNLVNIKQQYFLQSVDSVTQQIISSYYQTEKRTSSIGAYLLGRLDIHLTRGFSITGDFNWMFDTGVELDETQFKFYDTTRKIDNHELKFNSYLIALGFTCHF